MNKFEIKDGLDRTLYSVYNYASELLFHLSLPTKALVRANLKYKDAHAGERCFILGTGPSLSRLSTAEIGALASEITIGVNSFYKSPLASQITPAYYALMDNLYWNAWKGAFRGVAETYPDRVPIFITDPRARSVLSELPGQPRAIYIHSKKYPVREMSAELQGNVFAAMNVVSYSILTAMFLGFRSIYLLGCDYNAFCSYGKGHCYDDATETSEFDYNLAFYLRFYWITTEFHYLIAKLAKSSGVSVVNVTPDSLLDAYPRRDLATALQAR